MTRSSWFDPVIGVRQPQSYLDQMGQAVCYSWERFYPASKITDQPEVDKP